MRKGAESQGVPLWRCVCAGQTNWSESVSSERYTTLAWAECEIYSHETGLFPFFSTWAMAMMVMC